MKTETTNGMIVRYLLGDLPEEEQVRLEDRAFSDQEYLQTILQTENDLIDEYVHGELSAVERRQFEQRFLASAERQRKVEFARALAQITNANMVAQPAHRETESPSSRWWESLRVLLGSLSPVFQFSLATAALLLAIGLPWLIIQTVRLRTQVAQLQAERHSSAQVEELQRQLAEQQRQNQEMASQLQTQQQQLAQLQERPPKTPTTNPVVASLFLPPGLSRGEPQKTQLIIPPNANQVRLQIGIERGDDYKRYGVELRTLNGREVLRQTNLIAHAGNAGREVTLVLPADKLSTGEYELALHGISDDGKAEDLGYYYFAVQRK
ncbi:MAG: hypothetical protein JST85_27130 [Acidobacteria bacterium]|nr:hypothetical protein [Acidobacteriota bacterium]